MLRQSRIWTSLNVGLWVGGGEEWRAAVVGVGVTGGAAIMLGAGTLQSLSWVTQGVSKFLCSLNMIFPGIHWISTNVYRISYDVHWIFPTGPLNREWAANYVEWVVFHKQIFYGKSYRLAILIWTDLVCLTKIYKLSFTNNESWTINTHCLPWTTR